jgi:transposase-like protein/transposase Tn5 family protein
MHKITMKDFPHLDFGDIRRDQRFISLLENISQKPGASIPKQSGDWYNTKATYNFFKNEQVTLESLNKTISAYGVSKVKELKQVLILHDMSNISFNHLQAEGLGYLDSKEGRGIMCYTSMAASVDGLPLALLHQNTWIRPLEELGKAEKRKQRNFEDKESYKWYEGMTNVQNSIGPSIHKIHIADRGADIYELFFNAYEENTDLLIRAHFNRKLRDGSDLWDSVSGEENKGNIILKIPDAKGRKKDIEAEVRYKKVEILRPSRSNDKYESVELTAIEVRQKGVVSNEEDRICWRLLTTLEVTSLSDVVKYIRWYTYRWLIERFHYVLKSGTKIEELQLKDATSLQKAVAVYSLAGFKIMQMVYESRHYPDVSCEIILTKKQWIALCIMINPKADIPQSPPSFSQAVRWIGKLGGHLGRNSDGPPGLKTVWLGYQRLCDAASMYEILSEKNLGKG